MKARREAEGMWLVQVFCFSAETAAVSEEQQQLSDPTHSRTLTPPPHGGREREKGVSNLAVIQA